MIRESEQYQVEVGTGRSNRIDWAPIRTTKAFLSLADARKERDALEASGRYARVVRSLLEVVEDDDQQEILIERRWVKPPKGDKFWVYNLWLPPGLQHKDVAGFVSVAKIEKRAKEIAAEIGATVRRAW